MIPNAFMVLEKLPLSSNGKVDRTKLPLPSTTDRIAGVSNNAANNNTNNNNNNENVDPTTAIEILLASVWKAVLQVNAFSSFF